MKAQSLLIFVLVLHAGAAVAQNSVSGSLTVTAQTPVVPVKPHPPGRYFLSLPTLEYAFDVEAGCSDSATPASLSINVADSRLTLSAAELEGKGQQKLMLEVPAQQIAPIAVDNFCVIDVNEAVAVVEPVGAPVSFVPDTRRITVGAALSAQVSLLCSSDKERKITYLAQPLDVALTCEVPPIDSAEAAPQNPADN